MEEPVSSGEIRNPDGTFKKGISGNPLGKPKGTFSIKTKIIKRLEENPEQLDEVIQYLLNKEDLVLVVL
jgi:hypothetical protein